MSLVEINYWTNLPENKDVAEGIQVWEREFGEVINCYQ